MRSVVAKVIAEDGSEESFGPVWVTNDVADGLSSLLSDPEAKRLVQVATEREEAVQAEVDARNEAAQAEQDRREALAAEGIDPDAPVEG